MNTTSCPARYQQQRIAQVRANCDSYQFFNLLTSDVLFDRLETLLPEHRERQFPPTETLSMFLAQVMNSDRSCQLQNTFVEARTEIIKFGHPKKLK